METPTGSKRKKDRRINRTRQALREALNSLVKEKGYEAVTVEEITERANLGRTTFYLHYHDKEDLFLEELEQKLSELVEEMKMSSRPLIDWFLNSQEDVIMNIFEMVRENADIFNILVNEQSNKVSNRFRNLLVQAGTKLITESPTMQKRTQDVSMPIELILNYFAGSLWFCITWWVENEYFLSIEEMTEFYRKMFFPGLLTVIEVKKIELNPHL